jgi:hypothetical protein
MSHPENMNIMVARSHPMALTENSKLKTFQGRRLP